VIEFVRAEQSRPAPPLSGLPTMQRRIVEAVDRYAQATGEPCPGRFLARHLNLHHKTVQTHLSSLYRKGWLKTPGAPVFLSRRCE